MFASGSMVQGGVSPKRPWLPLPQSGGPGSASIPRSQWAHFALAQVFQALANRPAPNGPVVAASAEQAGGLAAPLTLQSPMSLQLAAGRAVARGVQGRVDTLERAIASLQHDFDLIVAGEAPAAASPYLEQAPMLFAQTLNGVNPPWGLDVALREVLADTTLAEGLRWELITHALRAGMPLPVVLRALNLPARGYDPDVWRVETLTAQLPSVARAVAAGCSCAQSDQTYGPFASAGARVALDQVFCRVRARTSLEQGLTCEAALQQWGRRIFPGSAEWLRFLAFRDDPLGQQRYEMLHGLEAEPQWQQVVYDRWDSMVEASQWAWRGEPLAPPNAALQSVYQNRSRICLEVALANGCAGRDVWQGQPVDAVIERYGLVTAEAADLLAILHDISTKGNPSRADAVPLGQMAQRLVWAWY